MIAEDTVTIPRKEYEALTSAVALLKFQLAELQRLIFGQKTERYVPEAVPGQTQLDLGFRPPDLVEDIPKRRIEAYDRKHGGGGRNSLPENLPVVEVVLEPERDTSDLKRIGVKTTEVLEYEEARLLKLRYLRPVYGPKGGDGPIVTAELPFRPVEKGLPGPKLGAKVVEDKYVYHIPLHRQCKKLRQLGADLSESTINGWVGKYVGLFTPLYDCARADLLGQDYLQADETTLKVLKHPESSKDHSHTGYLVPYHAPVSRGVFVEYQSRRNQAAQERFLERFKGVLQTDGHNSYDTVAKRPDIVHAGCMAHARRKFEKALEFDKAKADHALRIFRLLFEVERMARRGKPEALYDRRLRLRRRHSKKLMGILKRWLEKQLTTGLLPKPPLGKAIHYALGRWKELCVFLEDGRVEISNNPIENLIRPIAVGRKNWLFGGSPNGARWAAVMFTFTLGCQLNGLNFFDYLLDVSMRISDFPAKRLSELLPWNWKPPSRAP